MPRLRSFGLLLIIAVVCTTILFGAAAAGETAPTNAFSVEGEATNDVESEEPNESEPGPAVFTITDVETNTPITVGETIEVTVELENTGEQTAQKEVWFLLDQYHKDDQDVTLAPNESTTVTLTYVSKSGDAKDWTLAAHTPDDTVERTVTIEEASASGGSSSSSGGYTYTAEGVFEIESFDVEEPIKAGEPLRMNATVTNTGTVTEEKLLWFAVDGSTVNETILRLSPGEETTVAIEYNTTRDDVGERTVSAHTPDGTNMTSIEIADLESEFRIDSVETNDPVSVDDWLTASVVVTNVGDIAGNETVALSVATYQIDEQRVELEPNESTTVELNYRVNQWAVGELNASVTIADHEETFEVTVEEATPEPTSTPTPTPTESTETTVESTPSETETPADTAQGSVPGFGVVVTILGAVLGAAAVAARRL